MSALVSARTGFGGKSVPALTLGAICVEALVLRLTIGDPVYRILIAIVIATLLGGRCVPCRDLYAKAPSKSCCDKSGACTRIPPAGEKSRPCPIQQSVAVQKATSDTLKLEQAGEIELFESPQLLTAIVAPPTSIRPIELSADYSPPLLYVLHERFLI